jgi:hypothetical protein
MQLHAAQAEAGCAGEIRSRNGLVVNKLNSAKGMYEFRRQTYTEFSECGDAARQDTLAARLVNWRCSSVENRYAKAAPARCDRCSDARRSGPNYDDLAACSHKRISSNKSDASVQKEDGLAARIWLGFDRLFTNRGGHSRLAQKCLAGFL